MISDDINAKMYINRHSYKGTLHLFELYEQIIY